MQINIIQQNNLQTLRKNNVFSVKYYKYLIRSYQSLWTDKNILFCERNDKTFIQIVLYGNMAS